MESMVNHNKILKQAYKGKKVLLTGHTGFKGAWMLSLLHQLGANIKGYALAPKSSNDLYNLIDGDHLCNSIIADLRDTQRLENEIEEFQPDFIFHFAAQPLVRESYRNPKDTYEVNVIGTLNILEALKKVNQKCSVVMITTDKVYYNHEWEFAYRENDTLGGKDPYSASKACSELVIQSYQHAFFPKEGFDQHKKAIAVARAGNIIGGGDWSEDRLIPDFIRAVYADKAITIRYPNAVRPWQHVLDPLLGYLQLGQKLDENPLNFSEPFNFGPTINDCVSVEKIITKMIDSWGEGKMEKDKNIQHMKESNFLMLDTTKVSRDLGWNPKLSLEESIQKTVEWYAVLKDSPSEIKAFTQNQIKTYLEL